MLKKVCLVFLLFAFISGSQLLAKEGIKNAVKASHAGNDSAEGVNSTDHANAVNGKVIKIETMEDMSTLATIKDSKGELHRCKML